MALEAPSILSCSGENWRIANSARSGGISFSGSQQFTVSPSARWVAKASFLLTSEDDYLEARGFLAGLDGPSTSFLIGPVDWRGQPWNADALTGARITPDLAALDRARDPAFDSNPDTTGRLTFRLEAAAALNATFLSIRRIKGGKLRRGQYLQIGERLHIIVSVETADPVDSAGNPIEGVIGVRVRPWMRAAYAAGTPVNFENPRCLMRLADPDQGGIDMTTSPLSELTLDLTEAV